MAEWEHKVFWSETKVVAEDGGYAVQLDSRPIRTPSKQALILPTRTMAEAMAQEWAAQEGTIDPLSMPVTRAANSAIDKVAPLRNEVIAEIAGFGGTDLLCYRAEHPRSLAERQRQAWDPLLDWAAEALEARLVPVAGVMPVEQPGEALARLTEAVERRSDFELTALSDLVGISGSLVIGLAVAEGQIDPETGWDISRVDEQFQQEQWGRDEEAEAMAAAKREAFLNAHRFNAMSRC